MGSVIETRQVNDGNGVDDGGDDGYWGYSNTAIAIKYAVLGAIVLLFIAWFVGGYYHAQRRIRNGKKPLAYHMFLVPRRQRAQFFTQPRPFPSYYNQQQGVYRPQEYPLQAYPPPPPAYNAEHYAPPEYQPPEGGSKINPQQDYTAPPPGAPPSNVERGESSNAAARSDVGLSHGDAGPPSPEVSGDLPPRERPRSSMMARMNPFNRNST